MCTTWEMKDVTTHVICSTAVLGLLLAAGSASGATELKLPAPPDDPESLGANIQRTMTLERNESLVGTTGDVLASGFDRMESGRLSGRLPDNRIVHFAGNPSSVGDIVRLRITKANKNSLSGEIVR